MPLYFGVFISLFAYLIGMELKKKFGWPVLNPLLVAIILVIAFLKATGITYTDYNEGASYISYFLTPATVCLAIPLYKQLELLKKNLTAVATAITAGVIGSVADGNARQIRHGQEGAGFLERPQPDELTKII